MTDDQIEQAIRKHVLPVAKVAPDRPVCLLSGQVAVLLRLLDEARQPDTEPITETE